MTMTALKPFTDIPFPALDDFELAFAPWDQLTPVRPASSAEEERRHRRKISNRESARRSRMRKQRHLEGLRCEADRLGAQKSGLADRLGELSYYVALLSRDNARLRSQSATLHRRLAEIHLVVLRWRLMRMPRPPAAANGMYVPGNDPISASSMV